jgi:hypothetical protein
LDFFETLLNNSISSPHILISDSMDCLIDSSRPDPSPDS